MSGEGEVWVSLLRELPPDLALDKWKKMDGWMDGWMDRDDRK